jgi:hypothetical protein
MVGRLWLLVSASILGLVINGNFVSGQSDMSPDAATILEHYRQSLSWLESVSMKIDINVVPTGFADKGQYGVMLLFRHDRGQAEWRGSIFPYDANGNKDPNLNHTINDIFTTDYYVSFGRPANEQLRGAFVSKDPNQQLQGFLDDPGRGSPLWGRIFGNNHKNIADLLAESTDLIMREEDLEDIPCYVLEGITKYGKVTAWIAPQMGYSAQKWSIEKRSTDLFDDNPNPAALWIAAFDSVRFQEVNNKFIPTRGVFTLRITQKDGSEFSSRETYTTSDVQLNPDFAVMEAFKIDLPNGTRVYSQEAPGIRYKWKDGAVVSEVDGHTFEEIDKMIEDLKKQEN